MDILHELESSLVEWSIVAFVSVCLLILIGFKIRSARRERQWMEEDFDKKTASDLSLDDLSEQVTRKTLPRISKKLSIDDEDDWAEDGELLDNGDFVGKVRVVDNDNLSGEDITGIFNDDISVSNSTANEHEQAVEKSNETDVVSEYKIGDLDLDEHESVNTATALDDDRIEQTQHDLFHDMDAISNADLESDTKVDVSKVDVADDLFGGYLIDDESTDSNEDLLLNDTTLTNRLEGKESPHHTPIALTVMAKEDDFFEGADLLRDFFANDVQLHEPTGFYCRSMPGFPNEQLFCIASVVEPGFFSPEKMSNFKTKGLLLFMNLPNKMDPVQALQQCYEAAEKLAKDLDGVVCDSQMNELSVHRLEQMQDEMHQLALKLEVEDKKQNQ